MSINPREEEKAKVSNLNQKRRNADRMRERYQKHTIENLIRQAEYKQSLGMELTPDERFVLDNKSFLLRHKRKMEEDK